MNSVHFILLIGFVICQSTLIKSECDWYKEDITLKELKGKGEFHCAKYTCDEAGSLNHVAGCPLSMIGHCPPPAVLEEVFDEEKPYPHCCSTYKCNE